MSAGRNLIQREWFPWAAEASPRPLGKTGYSGRGGREGGVGAKAAAPIPLGTAPSSLLSSPLYISQVYTTAVHALGPGKVTGIREERDRQP